jgi:4-hydroxyproline epimerase
MNRVNAVDSHTAGEPTRVVISGGPDLETGSMQARLDRFRAQYDRFRSAVVNEPRGSDVLVGALLCAPVDPSASAGVIFFNNVGYLGMCGHGTIGLVATLAHLGRIEPGRHAIETPVGTVHATLHPDGSVSVENVPSYRTVKDLEIQVPGYGPVRGDIAWAGNWFFLARESGIPLERSQVGALLAASERIRAVVNAAGHPEVDHVELIGAPAAGGNARNFVLCPGGAYDRSPCGTGTSAKLACLAADGTLGEGETWVQESVIGTSFRGSYRWLDKSAGKIIPTVTGEAYVTAECTLLLNEEDPLCWGLGTP